METEASVPEAERRAWEEEFAAAARRPLAVRMRYAFIRTYKPVLQGTSVSVQFSAKTELTPMCFDLAALRERVALAEEDKREEKRG